MPPVRQSPVAVGGDVGRIMALQHTRAAVRQSPVAVGTDVGRIMALQHTRAAGQTVASCRGC